MTEQEYELKVQQIEELRREINKEKILSLHIWLLNAFIRYKIKLEN